MKPALFILLLFILITGLYGQDSSNYDAVLKFRTAKDSVAKPKSSKWTIGVKGGWAITWVGNRDWKNTYDQSFQETAKQIYSNLPANGFGYSMPYSMIRSSFSAGIFINYAITRRFSIQPEIFYSSKGFTANPYLNIAINSVQSRYSSLRTFKYDYIEAPILIKVNLLTRKFKPYLLGGPVFGLALFPRIKEKVDKGYIADDVKDQLKSFGYSPYSTTTFYKTYDESGTRKKIKTYDIGVYFGGGFDWQLSKKLSLTFEVRYNKGFTKLYYIKSNTSKEITTRNSGVFILTGIGFKIGT